MKIAVVGGDDLVSDDDAQLCAALAAYGHQVTHYARHRAAASAEVLTEQAHRTVRASAGPPAPLPEPEVLPFVGDWAAELSRVWWSDPPDIVHAHGWLGGLAAQLAARRQRLPIVQSFHGLAAMAGPHAPTQLSANAERARLEPLLARNGSWVTGGSSAEVDALARLRRSRARLSVLSTGVDVTRFSPASPARRRGDVYRVLCLEANPLPCNGFDRTIRILPKLSGAEVVIAETVGAEDQRYEAERTALRNLATALGVRDRVRFLGNVVDDELPELLRSADVLACTPRQWPQAAVALQAMACGLPVVAEAVGALADTVVHSVTGLVVSPNSPGELAAALKTLQTQTFQSDGMGAGGRSRVAARYTWERIAFEALNIFEKAGTEYASAAGGGGA